MLPSPAVVTMNSELQVLQKYLFPDSLANSIPLIVGLSHYSFTRWGGQPESAALSPLSQFDSRSSGWPAHAGATRIAMRQAPCEGCAGRFACGSPRHAALQSAIMAWHDH